MARRASCASSPGTSTACGACARKGFLDWLAGSQAQVVCLQEVRACTEQLDPELRDPEGWSASFVAVDLEPAVLGRDGPSRWRP